jgi:hypothetical protein
MAGHHLIDRRRISNNSLSKENEVKISSNFRVGFFTERHKQYNSGNFFALTRLLFTYESSHKKSLSVLRCRTTSSQLVLSDRNSEFLTKCGSINKGANGLTKKADGSKIAL